ncbi:MAG: outer membrane lipid asymmetry maintenance protein MlaD [Snodgrassella sp.]|uniref:Outer membrane lipid asymmetry maintenance protein MlaD n=1 Tax=Snodgrassella alvi TaxID=1196083 RepID=A0A2N9XRQ8_9NEIS|nr:MULTISPECIES: outer membrane lipid asymmetry maintenance protein MlaD [Snodgrassella]MCO6508095.1 outer membrane lipid asymmetry maintenance protein MlaD [Snodgrassella sp.]MCO6514671.1 outer membrane lipid asymmetry maintenance protein MlaD [Snodgrassella sp.]MCO6515567.1 outer membrane lipid asymmetry maintenance protein MlaD [Snodgrassella sp.]MCO6517495.1 outer membrane lipid asymmetry maintenance protein MlaD [Snodgrassella sp.]MCO6519622.1 outer membrane lipid asymmetry maintenance pr
MKKNSLEMLVGLFVLIGIVAILFLSFRVAGGNGIGSAQPSYTVTASFNDIGGLKAQAPVKIAGVVIGRVDKIVLDTKDYQAKVTLKIDKKYQLSTDTSAQILTSGLLGDQYIGLSPGGDPDNLTDGSEIYLTGSALVLEQLIGKFMTNFAEGNAKSDNKTNSTAASN